MWAVERNIIDSALSLLEWARVLPNYEQDEAGQIEFVLCEEQNIYESALGYFQQALQICREKGYTEFEGHLHHNIGNALSNLGRPQEGLTHLYRDLDECRRCGDTQGEARTLNTIALALSRAGDNPQAERLLADAIEKYQECQDMRHEADAQNDRGAILQNLGRTREALECHKKDLQVCNNLEDRRGAAVAHIHIAQCLIDLSNSNADAAIEHAHAAMNLADPQQDAETIGLAHLALVTSATLWGTWTTL